MVLYLIRYGEMALKSKNVRVHWQRILISNIEAAFARERLQVRVEAPWGRLFVTADDAEAAERVLSRTFGIVSFSPVTQVPSGMDDIRTEAARLAREKRGFKTFRIRARRTGQQGYTSMDVSMLAGEAVLKAMEEDGTPVNVDLHDPEFVINIEVRESKAFLFTDSIPGTGGLPLGTQGGLVMVLSPEDIEGAASVSKGGLDNPAAHSLLAAYLMMKRGCRVHPVFSSEVDASQFMELYNVLDPGVTAETVGSDEPIKHSKVHDPRGIVVPSRFADAVDSVQLGQSVDLPTFVPLSGLDDGMLKQWTQDMVQRLEVVRAS